jgi:peptidoglycan-N-acetylmuramic acid deacetylase
MAAEGHLVCNHTFTHRNLCGAASGALTAELKRLEEACSAIGVTVSPYYRPPEGCFDEAMLREAQSAGYKTVFWSFAYADWDNAKQPDPAASKRRILDNLHNGAVILLHPTSATNAAILGDVLREMKALGYRFGGLDELTGGEGN